MHSGYRRPRVLDERRFFEITKCGESRTQAARNRNFALFPSPRTHRASEKVSKRTLRPSQLFNVSGDPIETMDLSERLLREYAEILGQFDMEEESALDNLSEFGVELTKLGKKRPIELDLIGLQVARLLLDHDREDGAFDLLGSLVKHSDEDATLSSKMLLLPEELSTQSRRNSLSQMIARSLEKRFRNDLHDKERVFSETISNVILSEVQSEEVAARLTRTFLKTLSKEHRKLGAVRSLGAMRQFLETVSSQQSGAYMPEFLLNVLPQMWSNADRQVRSEPPDVSFISDLILIIAEYFDEEKISEGAAAIPTVVFLLERLRTIEGRQAGYDIRLVQLLETTKDMIFADELREIGKQLSGLENISGRDLASVFHMIGLLGEQHGAFSVNWLRRLSNKELSQGEHNQMVNALFRITIAPDQSASRIALELLEKLLIEKDFRLSAEVVLLGLDTLCRFETYSLTELEARVEILVLKEILDDPNTDAMLVESLVSVDSEGLSLEAWEEVVSRLEKPWRIENLHFCKLVLKLIPRTLADEPLAARAMKLAEEEVVILMRELTPIEAAGLLHWGVQQTASLLAKGRMLNIASKSVLRADEPGKTWSMILSTTQELMDNLGDEKVLASFRMDASQKLAEFQMVHESGELLVKSTQFFEEQKLLPEIEHRVRAISDALTSNPISLIELLDFLGHRKSAISKQMVELIGKAAAVSLLRTAGAEYSSPLLNSLRGLCELDEIPRLWTTFVASDDIPLGVRIHAFKELHVAKYLPADLRETAAVEGVVTINSAVPLSTPGAGQLMLQFYFEECETEQGKSARLRQMAVLIDDNSLPTGKTIDWKKISSSAQELAKELEDDELLLKVKMATARRYFRHDDRTGVVDLLASAGRLATEMGDFPTVREVLASLLEVGLDELHTDVQWKAPREILETALDSFRVAIALALGAEILAEASRVAKVAAFAITEMGSELAHAKNWPVALYYFLASYGLVKELLGSEDLTLLYDVMLDIAERADASPEGIAFKENLFFRVAVIAKDTSLFDTLTRALRNLLQTKVSRHVFEDLETLISTTGDWLGEAGAEASGPVLKEVLGIYEGDIDLPHKRLLSLTEILVDTATQTGNYYVASKALVCALEINYEQTNEVRYDFVEKARGILTTHREPSLGERGVDFLVAAALKMKRKELKKAIGVILRFASDTGAYNGVKKVVDLAIAREEDALAYEDLHEVFRTATLILVQAERKPEAAAVAIKLLSRLSGSQELLEKQDSAMILEVVELLRLSEQVAVAAEAGIQATETFLAADQPARADRLARKLIVLLYEEGEVEMTSEMIFHVAKSMHGDGFYERTFKFLNAALKICHYDAHVVNSSLALVGSFVEETVDENRLDQARVWQRSLVGLASDVYEVISETQSEDELAQFFNKVTEFSHIDKSPDGIAPLADFLAQVHPSLRASGMQMVIAALCQAISSAPSLIAHPERIKESLVKLEIPAESSDWADLLRVSMASEEFRFISMSLELGQAWDISELGDDLAEAVVKHSDATARAALEDKNTTLLSDIADYLPGERLLAFLKQTLNTLFDLTEVTAIFSEQREAVIELQDTLLSLAMVKLEPESAIDFVSQQIDKRLRDLPPIQLEKWVVVIIHKRSETDAIEQGRSFLSKVASNLAGFIDETYLDMLAGLANAAAELRFLAEWVDVTTLKASIAARTGEASLLLDALDTVLSRKDIPVQRVGDAIDTMLSTVDEEVYNPELVESIEKTRKRQSDQWIRLALGVHLVRLTAEWNPPMAIKVASDLLAETEARHWRKEHLDRISPVMLLWTVETPVREKLARLVTRNSKHLRKPEHLYFQKQALDGFLQGLAREDAVIDKTCLSVACHFVSILDTRQSTSRSIADALHMLLDRRVQTTAKTIVEVTQQDNELGVLLRAQLLLELGKISIENSKDLLDIFKHKSVEGLSAAEATSVLERAVRGELAELKADLSLLAAWLTTALQAIPLRQAEDKLRDLLKKWALDPDDTTLIAGVVSAIADCTEDEGIRTAAIHAACDAVESNIRTVGVTVLEELGDIEWMPANTRIRVMIDKALLTVGEDPTGSVGTILSAIYGLTPPENVDLNEKVTGVAKSFLGLWTGKALTGVIPWRIPKTQALTLAHLMLFTMDLAHALKKIEGLILSAPPDVSQDEFERIRQFIIALGDAANRKSSTTGPLEKLAEVATQRGASPTFRSRTLQLAMEGYIAIDTADAKDASSAIIKQQYQIVIENLSSDFSKSLYERVVKELHQASQIKMLDHLLTASKEQAFTLLEAGDPALGQEIIRTAIEVLLERSTPDHSEIFIMDVLKKALLLVQSGLGDDGVALLRVALASLAGREKLSVLKAVILDTMIGIVNTYWAERDVQAVAWLIHNLLASGHPELLSLGNALVGTITEGFSAKWTEDPGQACNFAVNAILSVRDAEFQVPHELQQELLQMLHGFSIQRFSSDLVRIAPLLQFAEIPTSLVRTHVGALTQSLNEAADEGSVDLAVALYAIVCLLVGSVKAGGEKDATEIATMLRKLLGPLAGTHARSLVLAWLPLLGSPLGELSAPLLLKTLDGLCRLGDYAIAKELLAHADDRTMTIVRDEFLRILGLFEYGQPLPESGIMVLAVLIGISAQERGIPVPSHRCGEHIVEFALALLAGAVVDRVPPVSSSPKTKEMFSIGISAVATHADDRNQAFAYGMLAAQLAGDSGRKERPAKWAMLPMLASMKDNTMDPLKAAVRAHLKDAVYHISDPRSELAWIPILFLDADSQEVRSFVNAIVEEAVTEGREVKDKQLPELAVFVRRAAQILLAAGFTNQAQLLRRRVGTYLSTVRDSPACVDLLTDAPFWELEQTARDIQRAKIIEFEEGQKCDKLLELIEALHSEELDEVMDLLVTLDDCLGPQRLMEIMLPVRIIADELEQTSIVNLTQMLERRLEIEGAVPLLAELLSWHDLKRGLIAGDNYVPGNSVSNAIGEARSFVLKRGWWSWDDVSGNQVIADVMKGLSLFVVRLVLPHAVQSQDGRYFDPDWLVRQRTKDMRMSNEDFASKFALTSEQSASTAGVARIRTS